MLYYKRKDLEDVADKDAVTKEIIKVTDNIKNVKSELFLLWLYSDKN